MGIADSDATSSFLNKGPLPWGARLGGAMEAASTMWITEKEPGSHNLAEGSSFAT